MYYNNMPIGQAIVWIVMLVLEVLTTGGTSLTIAFMVLAILSKQEEP